MDFSFSCPNCKTGAEVIPPIKTSKIQLDKCGEFFFTYSKDLMISEKLYKNLIAQKCNLGHSAICYNQNGKKIPYYQLIPEITLPKALTHKGFRQGEHCPVCKRNNYGRIDLFREGTGIGFEDIEFSYPKKLINEIAGHDILYTYECVFNSIISPAGEIKVLPRPFILVSDRFKKVLQGHGLKYIEYWPVKFK